ncbi:hypothetical protein G3I19_03775 [Streptomyces sp. SID10853]|nr:hypothetical protein [Streptomyces sp. SID10853]
MPASPTVPVPPARRAEPLQRLLFGGIYGTILASALAAALDNDHGSPNPAYDALWILLTSLASAAAHGYAHAIAHRTADGVPVTTSTVRSVLTEWPLIAAVLPTVAALLGAHEGWWGEDGAIAVALLINTVALFGWGFWAARVAGRSWGKASRTGGMDMLIGLFIVTANILIH